MGLLRVRNASEPSFTSGSIIALLPDRVVAAAAPLVSSDRDRRGEGAGFFSHKRGSAGRGVGARRRRLLLAAFPFSWGGRRGMEGAQKEWESMPLGFRLIGQVDRFGPFICLLITFLPPD